MRASLWICCVIMVFGAILFSQMKTDLSRRARELHFSSLVLDTHVDTTPRLLTGWNMAEEHGRGHVDLPRLECGGINGLFLSIYIPGTIAGARAVREALEHIAAVHDLARALPDRLALCTSAAQIREARKAGKIATLMGMEGGHMIDDSLPVLRMYAALGIRYLTLTHSVNTAWADSSGDQARHNGLTEFGKTVVLELNKLGVLVDVSHVSDKAFWDALDVSRAPMIASHSSCRALCDQPRNMTDEMIRALAGKGGVIQINYHIGFLDDQAAAYFQKAEPLFAEIQARLGGLENVEKAQAEIVRRLGPAPRVGWERVIDHIDHAVRLVGADHVGLGSDFDGAMMPEGLEDASRLPIITEGLLARGYAEKDIRGILGENTLGLIERAERAAAGMRQTPR